MCSHSGVGAELSLVLTEHCKSVGEYLRFGLHNVSEEMLISANSFTFRVSGLNLKDLHIFNLHDCELSRISLGVHTHACLMHYCHFSNVHMGC